MKHLEKQADTLIKVSKKEFDKFVKKTDAKVIGFGNVITIADEHFNNFKKGE